MGDVSEKVAILMAIPDVDDNVVADFTGAMSKCGVEVSRVEYRSTKPLVRQYLESHKDTGVIILSEFQGNEPGYTPQEIDRISVECSDAIIIPIISEKRGERYVSELCALGIYNALFDQQASYDEIGKLIRTGGRSKGSARSYYGIDTQEVVVQQGEKFDTRSAVSYLCKYNRTVEDLSSRLDELSKRLDMREIVDVLSDLPDDVFEMVSRIDSYSPICALLADARRNRRGSSSGAGSGAKAEDDESGKKERKLFGSKKAKKKERKEAGEKELKLSPVQQLALSAGRKTVEVGFVATNIGVGCTTSAIIFAAAVAKTHKGQKVAVVEFDDADDNFNALCMEVTGHQNTSGLYNFAVGGVDCFFHVKYSDFVGKYRQDYDLAVYDFGCLSTELIKEYFVPLDMKFVVTSPRLWKNMELVEFYKEVGPFDPEHEFIYLVSTVENNEAVETAQVVEPNTVAAVPFESNPFCPSDGTAGLFKSIYDGKYKYSLKRLGKAPDVKTLGTKAGKSSRSLPVGLLVGLATLALAVIGYLVYSGIRTRQAYQQTVAAFQQAMADKDGRLTELENSSTEMKEHAESLTRTVVILERDLKPGESISQANSETKEIESEISQQYYLSPDHVGKVSACVDIPAGVPVYLSQTAVPVPVPGSEEAAGEESAAAAEAGGATNE